MESFPITYKKGGLNMKRIPLLLLTILLSLVPISPAAAQSEPSITEYQVTSGPQQYTTPTLGRDAIGYYVVYEAYTPVSIGSPQCDIYYQRLENNGQPVGPPVAVAATSVDERLHDPNGDYIVYTRFDMVTSTGGKIMLYQISTGQTRELDSEQSSFSPKIQGDIVVWLKMTQYGVLLLMYPISSGVPVQPAVLDGPVPSPRYCEVSDRFVTWTQLVNGQYDVAAYDLLNGATLSVASAPTLDERVASTSGPWVAYQVSQRTTPGVVAIHARNLDTGETRIIADNGAYNAFPNIDGNMLSYDSNVSGNWEIYVYRLAEGDTFQVTSRTEDQRLNNILGNLVAYVDQRNGNEDIYVSKLEFVNPNQPPIANAGPDQALTLVGSTVQLDGTQSYDPDGDAITYAWAITSKPAGSQAALSNPASATPTFVADVNGTYVIDLVVKDVRNVSSASDSVTVSFINVKPVANAGVNQSVRVGQTVLLYGSGYDANNDPLSFNWYFSSKPAGSAAQFYNPYAAYTGFVADVEGSYYIALVTNDGLVNSDPSTVSVTAVSVPTQVTTDLATGINTINAMDPAAFKNSNMANALTNKINEAIALVTQGMYADALSKLQNDILAKTDGCAKGGAPDKNDWIRTCAEQQTLYALILDAINALK